MSTGSPNFGGTESVSRKAGAGNHQQDCVTCEELRDKIENLERNLSQMEHHSKTNARFVLQIETLHEENRKLTSDLASREAALIEQRTAKLRGDISPPGSTYKRTSASQARTKRPFEVPG
jgi:TolA-binding protein